MRDTSAYSDAILDALVEPALIVRGERTVAANRAARLLIGKDIVGRDLRLVVRNPLALETILLGREADVDVVGIGSASRSWHLSVRPIGGTATLVRLIDRSAVQAAERMRTDFVANASHELRTPLATIIGFAETLAEGSEIDEALHARFGATIESEARRMLRIVEDLMSLSRIEAGRFDAPSELVDLAEVARLSVDHAQPLLERLRCAVELSVDDPAPVRGDFAQLLQLADNLIGNALRYGCTATRCAVEVTVRVDGSKALLLVRDHGDGIAAEHLPRLTERFYRVDAARSRESGGTGLGLAIVKHIVERHRGTLDFRSVLGEGTQVTVAIPRAEAAVIKT
jgi:two-component system phosphate regulon sensor histidine kinase PhoR